MSLYSSALIFGSLIKRRNKVDCRVSNNVAGCVDRALDQLPDVTGHPKLGVFVVSAQLNLTNSGAWIKFHYNLLLTKPFSFNVYLFLHHDSV